MFLGTKQIHFPYHAPPPKKKKKKKKKKEQVNQSLKKYWICEMLQE